MKISRLPKIVGICIYFFVLITSFYHVFKFYEIFEGENESFVAFFVAFGFELSVLYFAYTYTKYKFTSARNALMLSVFIVWFGNIFVMTRNIWAKHFEIALLNADFMKFILPIIASVFIPVGSYYIGKIMANLDMAREDVKEVEVDKGVKKEKVYEKPIDFTHIESSFGKTIPERTDIQASHQDIETIISSIQAENEVIPKVHRYYSSIQASKPIPPFSLANETDEVEEIIEEIKEADLENPVIKEDVKQKILQLFRI